MNELALFAGVGGGILGGHLLGWRTIAAVEIEDYPRRVLLQRQADGLLPRFPIWDDICTFNGNPWRGKVDVITGGFPCQDISVAGKGDGLEGERSGLWREMARIIGEVRPNFVFVENSPMLVTRGLGTVLGDLVKLGFNAKWGVLGGDNAKLPHRRKRIWLLATHHDCKHEEWMLKQKVFEFKGISREYANGVDKNEQGLRSILSPGLCRTPNGLPHQMDRLKAVGNGQIPIVAATAWRILSDQK